MARERVSFVSNFGLPIVGQRFGISFRSRKPYWVDANNGDDGNDGTTPETARATIQSAVDDALSGDTILVFPGTYVENVVVDGKDYITIAGAIKSRYGWPDINPATGMALSSVLCQGLHLRQLRLVTDADSDVARIQGNGFLVKNCVFDGDIQGATKALLRLRGHATDDGYTASEGRIKDCLFRGGGGVGISFDTAPVAVGVGPTDVQILNNMFQGITGADLETADTGTGTYSIKDAYIAYNLFRSKNKAVYIDFTTANGGAASDQTGIIANNIFADDALDTTKVKIGGTGFVFVGNMDSVGIQDGNTFDN